MKTQPNMPSAMRCVPQMVPLRVSRRSVSSRRGREPGSLRVRGGGDAPYDLHDDAAVGPSLVQGQLVDGGEGVELHVLDGKAVNPLAPAGARLPVDGCEGTRRRADLSAAVAGRGGVAWRRVGKGTARITAAEACRCRRGGGWRGGRWWCCRGRGGGGRSCRGRRGGRGWGRDDDVEGAAALRVSVSPCLRVSRVLVREPCPVFLFR